MKSGKNIACAFVILVILTVTIFVTHRQEIFESAWVRSMYYEIARQYHRAKYEISGEYRPSYYVPGHGTIVTSRFTPAFNAKVTGSAEFEAIYFADDIGAQISKIDNRGTLLWQFQGTSKTRSLFRHKNQIGFVEGDQVKFLDSKSGVPANTINPGIGRISCAHITPPPVFFSAGHLHTQTISGKLT